MPLPNPSNGASNSDTRPRIGNIEPVTMRCDYQLPWNRKSNQTACGQTIQNQNGDYNWRIVIEGILTLPQLNELRRMRGEGKAEVVTQEFGAMKVAFDQLNIERVSEEAVGEVEGYQGPIVNFQLQTKEDEEGEGIEFFNDNTRGSQNG